MVQYEKVLDKMIKIVDANYDKFAEINSIYRLVLTSIKNSTSDNKNKNNAETSKISEQ